MSMQVSSDNRPSSGQESQEWRKSKGKEIAVVAPKGKEKRVANSQGSNNILGVSNIYQHPMPMYLHVNSECLMICSIVCVSGGKNMKWASQMKEKEQLLHQRGKRRDLLLEERVQSRYLK